MFRWWWKRKKSRAEEVKSKKSEVAYFALKRQRVRGLTMSLRTNK